MNTKLDSLDIILRDNNDIVYVVYVIIVLTVSLKESHKNIYRLLYIKIKHFFSKFLIILDLSNKRL